MNHIFVKKSGYTLVEMAVVIVIIGLLVAGVLGGQELLKEARMKSLIKELESYKAASYLFREKYNGLPGDIRDIDKYFELASNCSALGADTGTRVCAGNGDGAINVYTESSYFWKHLEVSEMVRGNFTGLPGAVREQDMRVGVNIPRTSYPEVGVGVATNGLPSGDVSGVTWLFDGNYRNQFLIGRQHLGFESVGIFLDPIDTFAFDLKFDDGKPGTGIVRTRTVTSFPNCTVGVNSDPHGATYNKNYTKAACMIYYNPGL